MDREESRQGSLFHADSLLYERRKGFVRVPVVGLLLSNLFAKESLVRVKAGKSLGQVSATIEKPEPLEGRYPGPSQ